MFTNPGNQALCSVCLESLPAPAHLIEKMSFPCSLCRRLMMTCATEPGVLELGDTKYKQDRGAQGPGLGHTVSVYMIIRFYFYCLHV